MPAVWVSRSLIVIARFAWTVVNSVPLGTATAVFANVGMYLLAGSLMPSLPSSISDSTTTLVSALDCEAMRKMLPVVILRPASLSAQPNAFS